MYSPDRKPLTVAQLNTCISVAVDGAEELKNILVKGEISNFKPYRSKWGLTFYFTLKDGDSEIRAVMWGNAAQRVPFTPEDGMSVLITGSVTYYEQRGQMQLKAEFMEPDGEGALNLAFEQLRKRLETEGLFDIRHKKPIPMYPETIGVVTSPAAAALSDVCNVLGRRWPTARIILSPAPVQGEQAPPQIIEALERLDRSGLADVIILTRGGGSIEDLWAFNDEALARAVFNCKTPVITGVGHETDFTIVDFVSDLRAPTPSAAAEKSTPDREEELKKVLSFEGRLKTDIRKYLDREGRILSGNISRMKAYSPSVLLERNRERLNRYKLSLKMNMGRELHRERERLAVMSGKMEIKSPKVLVEREKERLRRDRMALRMNMDKELNSEMGRLSLLAGKMDAYSPLKVLGRGYSITRDQDGKTVKSVNDVTIGENISVILKDGTVKAEVLKTEGNDLNG